ncbi:ATP-binding protein [Deinococcus hohokamensis]|uniref:ATP-binding protein n=1 Tax=Deinococcus hohokamensis TaxID=309883 RepID=A0ABV9IF40_9DEIO
MPDSQIPWRLEVLGPPRLTSPEGRVLTLERKTAALLAYLALEGSTSRGQISELLWPQTPTAAARNNLVHLLRRLRDASGADLVDVSDVLTLCPALTVDALDLPGSAVPKSGGQLLAGTDFDDLPDLGEWILAQSEQLSAAQTSRYREQTAHLLNAGQASEAAALAELWTEAEPASEEAYRTLMRAQYDLGDRAAALRAYHRCKQALQHELGADPSADTQRLARDIDLGTVPRSGPRPAARIPLSVLRPPTLVGRDEVWARMEEIWEQRLGIMIEGDPGSGKSRLAQDFLKSRKDHQILFFQGRPGDAGVPYATHARNYRQTLAANPDLDLPEWVVRELARMLPELGEAPPPMTTEADKRRFYEAKYEVVRLVAERGPVIICTDDVQFMDEPSIEAGAYVGSRFWGDTNTMLRCLYCHRTGALPPYSAALLDSMYAAGVVVPIHLPPLGESAVTRLLADLDVPGGAGMASRVAAATRGNVQFVLETVKSMYERGGDAEPTVDTKSGIAAMIQERLARLSPNALQAARAAAVLRRDFTLELVTQTLGTSLLDTVTAWEELEEAQVVTGEAFSHDLVLETVLAQMPPAVCRVLHRSAARVLASTGGHPARVAAHWEEGEDLRQAAPWLVRAGEAAAGNFRFTEATEFYTRAEAAFSRSGDLSSAAGVRQTLRALAVRTTQPAS